MVGLATRPDIRGCDLHSEGAFVTLSSGWVASFLLKKGDFNWIASGFAGRVIHCVVHGVFHLRFRGLGASSAAVAPEEPEGKNSTQNKESQTKAHVEVSISGLIGQLLRKIYLAGCRRKARNVVLDAELSGWFGEGFVEGEHFSSLVGAAGPEEAAEAVAAFARDDVDVKMRDALADDVVHGDEGALRFHYLLHFAREHLSVGEKRADQGGGKIGQSGVVRFGNEQDVAGEKGTNVEEG